MSSHDKNDGRTHAEGCYAWGRNHYDCALGRIAELEARYATAHEGSPASCIGWSRLEESTMSDISKEQRYEIVGLTKAEVDRCMEVLCGGPMPWDRGYCFASSDLFARPSRYGPELQGIVDDAVHCGAQAATGDYRPLESEQD